MADSVSVSNMPDSGSKERVAYDLCRMIIIKEQNYARAHVLELYAQCIRTVANHYYEAAD
jgi:hypothetical protein